MNYSILCTVVLKVSQHDREDTVVYERPQAVDDGTLTTEALAIFNDMKSKGRLADDAELMAIGVARNKEQAEEMGALDERTRME